MIRGAVKAARESQKTRSSLRGDLRTAVATSAICTGIGRTGART